MVANTKGVVEYKPNFVAIAADDHKSVKNKPNIVFIFLLLKKAIEKITVIKVRSTVIRGNLVYNQSLYLNFTYTGLEFFTENQNLLTKYHLFDLLLNVCLLNDF